jgi:hypothetical protein
VRNGLLQGVLAVGALTLVGALTTMACGTESGSNFDEEQGPGAAPGSGSGPLGDKTPCSGIACQQVQCSDPNVTTTVTGIVTAPNGTLPLYNAIVYVPQEPLEPVAEGASCDRCGNVSGKPLVSAITDAEGRFVLENVPVGPDIPLVIQVGKWRREVKLSKVTQCIDNPITDVNLTRLPKNQNEGHLPKIAVTTGRCDQLACLLPKLGIDASEYTPNTGNGRLHLYRGATHSNVPAPAPTGTPDALDLWGNVESLKKYDMVMLSCECGEHDEGAGANKPNSAKNAMYDFAALGGRVFASHYHYAWTQTGPLKGTAQWRGGSASSDSTGPFFVDTGFPKGAALADWLVNVKATATHGEIPISQPREDVGSVVAPTQRWVYEKHWLVPNVVPDPAMPQSTKYLSVNTPVGKPTEEQCGKFVFADMHLYGGDVQPADNTALPNDSFPVSCSKDLTPEEKALAFLFFDLSSCVQDDTLPPAPPIK